MVQRVLLVLFVAMALGSVGPAALVAAQEASPTNAQSGPVCGVTPQPVEELIALAFPQGTPLALTATPIGAIAESDLPEGTLVDAALAAAADQVVQTWLVCYVTGGGARVFALMTDKLDASFLQQFIALPTSDSPEELARMLASGFAGTLFAGSTSTLATLGREVRLLDDGRIGGIWAVEGNSAFIILAEQDGAWLVDEIIDIAE